MLNVMLRLESMHISGSVMTNGTSRYEPEDGEGLQRGLSPKTCPLTILPQVTKSNNSDNTSKEVITKLAEEAIDNIVPKSNNSDCNSGDSNATTSEEVITNSAEEVTENYVTPIVCSPCSLDCQEHDKIEIISYQSELQMPEIMKLIQKDLSEPYSIYTYRFFIHNWPKLCFLALHMGKCIGAIVCKVDKHRNVRRGYIAMLAVDENFRKRKIGSRLVQKAIDAMIEDESEEIVLETEITNKSALKLYENLGFVRDKRLFRYYLNGVDALRLKLWLR